MDKLEDATCHSLEATRGRIGGSCRVDTWPSTSSPRARPPAKRAADTSPNDVHGKPHYLPLWTGTRGFERPVMFLRRVAEEKMVR